MNYLIKTPKLLHSLYGNAVWFLPNSKQQIYLTFDDGPVAGITDKCLDILNTYKVSATFFCVGENVIKNPLLFQRIIDDGHAVGNHSHNHIEGWSTENEVYFENVSTANKLIDSVLFRPPYGKAKRSQLKQLCKKYKVIMWDVLSADFDPKKNVDQCVSNVLSNTEAGSIIVLHDNEKCGTKMLKTLPPIIEGLKEKGFEFAAINASEL